jgi:5-methylthioadenosine/S-adenosylhomocysteine deaminase
MTRVELGSAVFVHASDIQLLEMAAIDQILAWQPQIVLVADPPLYLRDSGLRFVFAQQVMQSGRRGCTEARLTQQELADARPLSGFQVAAHPRMANLDQFAEAVRCARELRAPLNLHVGENAGDRHDEQIRALELARAFDGPLLINHAIHVTEGEMALLARHGVSVAHNPLSNMRLASGITRLPDMHAAGLRIGLGLDGGTNDTPDMFANMKAAVGLQRARLQRADTFPGMEDVLRMATLGGAEVLGLEKAIGSLSPGKRADVIILDPGDPNFAPRWDWLSQIVLNGQPSNVDYVFVEGRPVLAEGKLIGLSGSEILKAAELAAQRIRATLSEEKKSYRKGRFHSSAE